jgi:hypothetical protein
MSPGLDRVSQDLGVAAPLLLVDEEVQNSAVMPESERMRRDKV